MAAVATLLPGEDAEFAGTYRDGDGVLPVLAEIFNQMRDAAKGYMLGDLRSPFAAFWKRSSMQTRAPACWKRSAIALPMP